MVSRAGASRVGGALVLGGGIRSVAKVTVLRGGGGSVGGVGVGVGGGSGGALEVGL